MQNIKFEYFKLLEILNKNLLENDIIEILTAVDSIKLFFCKYKLYVINKIKNSNNSAIVGGMTYLNFKEKQYFLPLAHNKMLIIDEPICKMDELIRNDNINRKNIIEILKRTISIFIDNKEIILSSNINIVPLRSYYGIEKRKLHDLSKSLVYSMFSYMFDKEIKSELDFKNISNEFETFQSVEEVLLKNERDILFLGTELVNLSLTERVKKYYEDCQMNFEQLLKIESPIVLMTNAVYGYVAQIYDVLNTCEETKSDLYLFTEIPTFYFNILLENLCFENEEVYDKFLQTIISYYLQQYLYYTNFNNMDLEEFCKKYNNNNLVKNIKSDYLKNKTTKNSTDIKVIKDFVIQRVLEFYGKQDKNQFI